MSPNVVSPASNGSVLNPLNAWNGSGLSNTLNNDVRYNFTHTTFVRAVNPLQFKGSLSTIFPSGYAQPPSVYTPAQMAIQIGTGIANYDTLIIAPANANNSNDQQHITDTFSWTKGRHGLKFGVDYRQLNPVFDQSNFNWNNSFALTIGSTPNNCPGGVLRTQGKCTRRESA